MSADASALYPWGFVLAALGSVTAVHAIVQPFGRLGRVMSAAPLRWIGKRSYGIYLWHLPAFALATPDGRRTADVPLNAVAAAAAAVGLAALSYRFVEEPVRRRGFRATGAVALAVLIAGGGLTTATKDNTATDQIEAGRQTLENGPSPAPTDAPGPTDGPRTKDTPKSKDSPRPTARKVTAIGDSVMPAAAPALKAKFPGIDIDAEIGRQLTAAPTHLGARKQQGALVGDAVVIGLGTNGTGCERALQDAVDTVGPSKRIILITVHVPQSWQDSVNRAIREEFAGRRR
ncbi:hypothetical protein ADK70_22605 [Streptomyces rimosus subsp. pseudoverticillatus]|nr:hypothetical protein ADK70_22605 [Streptomyces rimosus subsp. pseudoverticillatus]